MTNLVDGGDNLFILLSLIAKRQKIELFRLNRLIFLLFLVFLLFLLRFFSEINIKVS